MFGGQASEATSRGQPSSSSGTGAFPSAPPSRGVSPLRAGPVTPTSSAPLPSRKSQSPTASRSNSPARQTTNLPETLKPLSSQVTLTATCGTAQVGGQSIWHIELNNKKLVALPDSSNVNNRTNGQAVMYWEDADGNIEKWAPLAYPVKTYNPHAIGTLRQSNVIMAISPSFSLTVPREAVNRSWKFLQSESLPLKNRSVFITASNENQSYAILNLFSADNTSQILGLLVENCLETPGTSLYIPTTLVPNNLDSSPVQTPSRGWPKLSLRVAGQPARSSDRQSYSTWVCLTLARPLTNGPLVTAVKSLHEIAGFNCNSLNEMLAGQLVIALPRS